MAVRVNGDSAVSLPSATSLPTTVAALLRWYRKHARELPWRRTADPYAIWISEVMLQQTQVQTVLPYWERWMRELPDVLALTNASLDQVLRLWEGLGYYSRARNLHRAAEAIARQHKGRFPRHYEALLELPGIGRYTAGAICSMAYDQPTAILDGNITRVLARLYGIAGHVRTPRVNRQLWRLAENLVQAAVAFRRPALRPCSALNQALMELGALICKPKQPDCPRCPVHRQCRARQSGKVNRLPQLGPRPKVEGRRFFAFVLRAQGRVLVRRRPAGVINGHLWEFPNVEVTHLREPVPKELGEKLGGCSLAELKPLCTIRHTITRYRIQLDAYQANIPMEGSRTPEHARWCTGPELNRLAFPSAHRRIATVLQSALASEGS